MTAMDEFVWLRHPDTDGWFHCPPGAVKAWMARGWEKAEGPPPEEDRTRDPAMLAALNDALAAEQAPPEPPAEDETSKPARASRRSAAATEEKE